MVAGTWTRTHDLLTKFLEDFYNLLSFSMLKVLARHLNFQTVTFCVTPIFVSFHRHQIWWKNNFILIWLLSLSFYLEQKSAFWLWKRKMQSRRTSSPTPTGFITAETFRPKFRKIREKIISSFLSKFRDCLGFGLARSLRSVFGSRRKIPKLNRVCWIFFHLGFEGEIICGNLCWIGFRSTLECSQGYFLQVRHFIARRWPDSMKPRLTWKGHL